ncbi:hypothetical protein DMI65_17425 [Escherichia coli]|nr:hypothetical protein [Escherichia coli]
MTTYTGFFAKPSSTFPLFINVKKRLCFGIKRKTQEDMSVTVLLSPRPLPSIVNAYHPLFIVAIYVATNLSKKIEEMVSIANRRNMRSDVTGILLFNGSHFFQLLKVRKNRFK